MLLVAAALAGGCSGLKPLPSPALPACHSGVGGGAGVEGLWACIDATPRREHPESAFTSTRRAADLARKRRDQKAESACRGPVPQGFEELSGIETEPGRPPLHAFYRPPAAGRPVIMVVHGLYDSKRTRYVEITAAALADAGFGVLAPDMRWHGCLLAKSWLPTLGVEEGADLAAWARWLHARQPDHAVGVVGFSLGALDALHAVGGRDGEVFDAGVIAVSPPAALGRTLERFDTRAYWRDRGALVLIDRFFRRTLERRMRDLGLDPGAQPFAELLAWRAAQAPPRFGLTPARLIELADPVPKIAAARRPLLLISDRIDPVFSGASVAELARAAAGNRWAHLVETPYGGHIGHPGTYPQWFVEVLVRFFSAAPEVAAADAVAGE